MQSPEATAFLGYFEAAATSGKPLGQEQSGKARCVVLRSNVRER